MTIGSELSALWSWLHFVSFTVLPVAFRELLHWLYEWQVLLTGILAVVAARIWGRSIVRAARIASNPRPAPVAEARRPMPAAVPVPLAAAKKATEPAADSAQPRPTPGPMDQLFTLREQIRITLGKMPCTDDLLTAERLADCRRIAGFPLSEVQAAMPKTPAHRFDVLRSELKALAAVRETDTSRNAWEALVRISTDARDLMGPEPAEKKTGTK